MLTMAIPDNDLLLYHTLYTVHLAITVTAEPLFCI